MKAILHSPFIDESIKSVKRRRFTDSADGQAMMCEAKVLCDEQTYYMSILDSDMPEFRIGRSPIIHRGVEGFKSNDGIVSRCSGLDSYIAKYGDLDFFTDVFEALYQMMDDDDDSVIFKRSGDIVIGRYVIAFFWECWWDVCVIGIMDALINSWRTCLPFAVATSNEGPDKFVFSRKGDDVMHVVEDSPSRGKKVGVTNIKFEDFRENFILGLKRFVRHPSRKPEEFCQEYTEQFRRTIKRKIKAYERAKERYDQLQRIEEEHA